MELKQLQQVLVLSQTLSFRSTAERLKVSQSALTRNIQAFEKEIGLRIFERTSQSVKLSAVGVQVVERIHSLLFEANCLIHESALLSQGSFGRLTVGAEPSLMQTCVRNAVKAFSAEFPHVSLVLEVRRSQEMLTSLHDRSIELFVGRVDDLTQDAMTEIEFLWQSSAGFFSRPAHPLAKQGNVSLDSIMQYGLCLANFTSHPADWLARRFGYAKVAGMPWTIQSDDMPLLTWLTANADHLLCCARASVESELASGALVELVPQGAQVLDFHYGFVHLKHHVLSPAAANFVKKLRDQSFY